ncbi:PREDICTED: uncharacterized protein LOC109297545 isoform X2 [Gavialis gangeticus]|uniref:uncharacterized protein LOC109297545 isoform X2 n=1 Tax=Gavialis gangeticus TaxID=94835 RepID=UPI00092EBD19|nr:PREDICTED: uncharacterized protein LOC109297545 isoform X2 [Gavialis gangeticus]
MYYGTPTKKKHLLCTIQIHNGRESLTLMRKESKQMCEKETAKEKARIGEEFKTQVKGWSRRGANTLSNSHQQCPSVNACTDFFLQLLCWLQPPNSFISSRREGRRYTTVFVLSELRNLLHSLESIIQHPQTLIGMTAPLQWLPCAKRNRHGVFPKATCEGDRGDVRLRKSEFCMTTLGIKK